MSAGSGTNTMSKSRRTDLRIGITCYPTYGGSGVVATELGIELAERGHQVHFITYSQPIRLTEPHQNIHYHEVEVSRYPLFEYPPYDLALATRMAEVAELYDLDSAARALRHPALGERHAGAADAGLRVRAGNRAGCLTSRPCTEPTSRLSAWMRRICRSPSSPSSRATG